MKEIKSLSIVTAQGANTYVVGCCSITKIKEYQKRIGEYEYLYLFRVFKGDNLHAEISQSCPFEVVYKEGD